MGYEYPLLFLLLLLFWVRKQYEKKEEEEKLEARRSKSYCYPAGTRRPVDMLFIVAFWFIRQ